MFNGVCEVPGCGKQDISNFLFPADPVLASLWARKIGKDNNWKPSYNSTICFQHFSSDTIKWHFTKNGRKFKFNYPRLRYGACPSIFNTIYPSGDRPNHKKTYGKRGSGGTDEKIEDLTKERLETTMLEERIITAVYNREPLWRTETTLIEAQTWEALWKEVSQEVGRDVEMVKSKWFNVRRKFFRELQKTKENSEDFVSSWVHFNKLWFLKLTDTAENEKLDNNVNIIEKIIPNEETQIIIDDDEEDVVGEDKEMVVDMVDGYLVPDKCKDNVDTIFDRDQVVIVVDDDVDDNVPVNNVVKAVESGTIVDSNTTTTTTTTTATTNNDQQPTTNSTTCTETNIKTSEVTDNRGQSPTATTKSVCSELRNFRKKLPENDEDLVFFTNLLPRVKVLSSKDRSRFRLMVVRSLRKLEK